MKKLIAVLVVIGLPFGGCSKAYTWDENKPTFHYTPPEESPTSFRSILKRDYKQLEQDTNDFALERDSIIRQQTELLKTLSEDEQISPAGFQLYKDFLVYIQQSGDQIKIYEFIEKMRAALPADKMETIETLQHQIEQSNAKRDTLRKRLAALKERKAELVREDEINEAISYQAAVNSMSR